MSQPKHDTGRSPRAIGARIARIREITGATQTAFAKGVGASQGTLSAWESGKRPPGLKAGHQLCDVYGVTLDYIFRGDISGLSQSFLRELNKLEP
jgi:transcriptional regulator with XRE-family HTH domain